MKLNKLMALATILPASLLLQLPALSYTSFAEGEKRETGCGVLRFTYDTALGHTIVCDDVPEHQILPGEPYWQAHPKYMKIQFSGYPYPGGFGLGPTIYVFPIFDVEGVYRSPFPVGQEDLWLREINDLEAVLRDRPTWTPPTWQPGQPVTRPPLLPLINAANVYLAKQEYIRFSNGSGVRYLAQITQDASPPTKENTFYIFEGIGKDSFIGPRVFISAVFPAFLATPPVAPANESVEEQARIVADALERAESGSFNPDLRLLDELVASFKVSWPRPTHWSPPESLIGMPDSGSGDGPKGYVVVLLTVALITLALGTKLRIRNRSE
ncbi:MAG: hypothetical protein M3441_00050 [Chloroflexota bacterium]|nr:hypothetical protein [Chloroflexota bacterium]